MTDRHPPPERRHVTLAVLVPALRRVHHLEPMLRTLVDTTPVDLRAIIVASAGDTAVAEETARLRSLFGPVVEALEIQSLKANRGDYARKVNAAARIADADYLFTGADDLRFHAGWWSAAVAPMADPVIAVVGTNDLGSPRVLAGEHSTHSLVRSSYVTERGTIDERGKVLHEGYWHEYVDDELIGTAKARGVYAHAAGAVVEHLHPNWDKAPTDDLYRLQMLRMEHSRGRFVRRRRLWTT